MKRAVRLRSTEKRNCSSSKFSTRTENRIGFGPSHDPNADPAAPLSCTHPIGWVFFGERRMRMSTTKRQKAASVKGVLTSLTAGASAHEDHVEEPQDDAMLPPESADRNPAEAPLAPDGKG